jgi:hypothetical protein
MFNDEVIEDMEEKDDNGKVEDWALKEFKCDPTLINKKCQFYFEIYDDSSFTKAQKNRQYVEVPCMCSLHNNVDGTPTGYCGSIIGTPQYEDSVISLVNILEKSECHTYDRYDYGAQIDDCGIGSGKTWKNAVNKMFEITYWPYVQHSDVRSCIDTFFLNSKDNLESISGASFL